MNAITTNVRLNGTSTNNSNAGNYPSEKNIQNKIGKKEMNDPIVRVYVARRTLGFFSGKAGILAHSGLVLLGQSGNHYIVDYTSPGFLKGKTRIIKLDEENVFKEERMN